MKRVLAMMLSAFLCMILLTACNQGNVIGGSDGPTNMVVSGQENNSTPVDAEKWFNEHYVDADKLPVLDVDIANPFVSDDRTLILDDSIENKLELLVYEYYHDGVAGAFADRKNKVVGEVMEINVNNEEKNFKDGIYLSKIILEKVDFVDKERINDVPEHHKQSIVKMLTEHEMTEFSFIEVEKTIKHNAQSLSMEPQLPDGEYTWYYLLGKTGDEFKIVEVSWGEWFPED